MPFQASFLGRPRAMKSMNCFAPPAFERSSQWGSSEGWPLWLTLSVFGRRLLAFRFATHLSAAPQWAAVASTFSECSSWRLKASNLAKHLQSSCGYAPANAVRFTYFGLSFPICMWTWPLSQTSWRLWLETPKGCSKSSAFPVWFSILTHVQINIKTGTTMKSAKEKFKMKQLWVSGVLKRKRDPKLLATSDDFTCKKSHL